MSKLIITNELMVEILNYLKKENELTQKRIDIKLERKEFSRKTLAIQRAEEMVETYIKWENETKNEIVDIELPFDVKIGDITFTGRIDRLEKNPDGKFEVVDFKSGKTVKSKNKAKTDVQLNIYAKVVEKLKGELPVKASLFYVEKDKMVEYAVTEESVNETIDTIKDMTKEILSENFTATPSYNACMFCSYQSICDAKVTEE